MVFCGVKGVKMSIINNYGRYVLEKDIEKELGKEALKQLRKSGVLKIKNITLKVVEGRDSSNE